MSYIDFNHILTLVSQNQITFSADQIAAADRELAANNSTISSISCTAAPAITLGITQNRDGDITPISAYCRGFWLGTLDFSDVENPSLKQIRCPMILHVHFGSALHDEAAALSREYSAFWGGGDLSASYDRALAEFAGKADNIKKSFHLNPESWDEIRAGAGQSQSGRLNTIIQRYRAIMNNPGLAVEIAEMDGVETGKREWADENDN